MGVTAFTLQLIEKAIASQPIKSVMELGAQNLYDKSYSDGVPFASDWYEAKGIKYACIDLSGENKALKIDLEKPFKPENQYDMVTDFGTGEHIRKPFNVFKAMYDLTKPGGLMIHENPKTGNWPKHGFWYLTEQALRNIAEAMNYEVKEIGEAAAMGNTKDGWNCYAVFRKPLKESKFIHHLQFGKMGICKS